LLFYRDAILPIREKTGRSTVMGRIIKVIASMFRFINFLFDCLQTWQYTVGGGMSGIITAVVAFYKGLPYWMIPVVAVVAGVVVVIVVALIFKAFTAKKHEEKRLNKLPRLILDIHKQICKVREHLVKHTNWDNVDTSKVLTPMLDIALGREAEQSENMDIISSIAYNLNEAGGTMRGAPSTLNTYMKEGDTDLTP